MPYRKDFVIRLKPNAKRKRYPDPEDLTGPLDGFYIHNRSSYTIYVNWDTDATGSDSDIPIPAGDWRDFGLRVDKFISVYCASDASVVDADVVVSGYRAIPTAPQTITLKRETPQTRQGGQYSEKRIPKYLQRGDHLEQG